MYWISAIVDTVLNWKSSYKQNKFPTLLELILGTRKKWTNKYLISEVVIYIMRWFKAEDAWDGVWAAIRIRTVPSPLDKVNRTTGHLGKTNQIKSFDLWLCIKDMWGGKQRDEWEHCLKLGETLKSDQSRRKVKTKHWMGESAEVIETNKQRLKKSFQLRGGSSRWIKQDRRQMVLEVSTRVSRGDEEVMQIHQVSLTQQIRQSR